MSTDETKIDVNINTYHQRIEGFGGSYAFYLALGREDETTGAENRIDELFGQDGLNIDILRINNYYDINTSNLGKTVSFVNDAKQTKATLKTLMSNWGPPANLKSNNDHTDGGTLKYDVVNGEKIYKYAEYAQWINNSIQDMEDEQNIKVDYLSIQNEPNYKADYHSCLFAPTEDTEFTYNEKSNGQSVTEYAAGYSNAFNATWEALATKYYNEGRTLEAMPKMMGPETIGLTNTPTIKKAPQKYIDDFDQSKLHRMYGYCHHAYQNVNNENSPFPDHLNTQMDTFKTKNDYKPLFQTEFAVLSGQINPGKTNWDRTFDLAKLMYNHLVEEEVSAYFYWSLLWQGSDRQGLIMYDNGTWTKTPEYWAFMHYSRFIDMDARRVNVESKHSEVFASGYMSATMDKLTLVLLNNQDSVQDFTFTMNGFTLNNNNIKEYVTTKSTDGTLDNMCKEMTPSPTNLDAYEIRANSITTLVLDITRDQSLNANEKPNVLFVSVDDLRPLTRSHDYPFMHTPTMDALSKEGFQFNNAYAQIAICGPSRASALTGTRPDSNLIYDLTSLALRDGPFDNKQTLPQFFKENGYYTVDCGKTFDARNFDVDSSDGIDYNANDDAKSWSLILHDTGKTSHNPTGKPAYYNPGTADDDVYSDGNIALNTVNYLKDTLADGKIQFTDANDARGDKPVFMAVGFKKPHLPFIAPGEYWDKYSDNTNLLPTSTATPINPTPYSYTYWDELRGYDDIPEKDTSTAAPGNQPSDEQKTNLVRGYQACVSYIDKLLGDIVTQLRDTTNSVNINNTVIVLWGDQGFHLGDKGQWCKHTNFDVATRIPLIIRDPRVLGGVRLNNVAEALDIYPTLRQLCHLGDATPSHHLEGKDLSSRLHYGAQDEAAHEPHNMAVTEYIRNNGNVIGYSIKDTRYKYTRWYNNVENHIDDADNRRYYVRDFSVCQYEELYDIYHDVDEVENIVAANQDTTLLRDLRMKFMNMVKNIPGEIHGPNTLLSQHLETTTQEDNSLLITLKTKMT